MTAATGYRPRRSVLYMPGSNERALEKAKTLACDGLILDLEDAVAPEAKDSARELVSAAARSGDYGRREVTIRVNGIGTAWHDADLAAVSAAGPDAVVVPKVESAGQVRRLAQALADHGAPEHTRLWAMVETPAAIERVSRIARASDRLACLVIGTNDLVKELQAEHVPGRAPVVTALSLAVLAARRAGIAILDGVFNDVRDEAGFAAECAQGRAMGFDGKTLIHPGQIDPCNEAFSPSTQAIADAEGVVAAWESADHSGVVTYQGRMVEQLHVDVARRILAVADVIGRTDQL